MSPTATLTQTPASVVGSIAGSIYYYATNIPVPQAAVSASGGAEQTVPTSNTGQYSFPSLQFETWNVAPGKTGDVSAVTSLDAAYVLQAVVGKRTFNQYQHLACDVNGDGTISALDATRILQFVVGKISRLPVASTCQSDWAFYPQPVPAPYQSVSLPQISPGVCQPGTITMNPLAGQANSQDFLGILFGDCTGNWQPPLPAGTAAITASTANPAQLSAGRIRRRSHRLIEVPVYVSGVGEFSAVEGRFVFDAHQMRLQGVRLAEAARGALVAVNVETPGVVTLAIASAAPVPAGLHPVVTLKFEPLGTRSTLTPVRPSSATIDDRLARTVGPAT